MRRREFLCLATMAATAMPFATRGFLLPPDDPYSKRRFTDTRFGRIAAIDRGEGPPILFLHGFPLSAYQWRDAIALLEPTHRCIAPDFMGLGYTEPTSAVSLAPESQAEMLLALLDALGISDVDVIASDSGGQVAQLLVASSPERVNSLLLTNCDTEIDSPPAALLPAIALAKAGTYADLSIARQLADPEFTRTESVLGKHCYVDPAHPTDAAIREYFRPLLRSDATRAALHGLLIGLERNPLIGVAQALGRFRGPVRIVWGMSDTIFKAESPAYLDSVFGRSLGVREIPGRKLFWPEELPNVIAEEYRFVQRAVQLAG